MSAFTLSVDDIADALRGLTQFDMARLRDRFDVEELLAPDAEVERVEREISLAEGRLERIESKITQAHIRLNAVNTQIETKTQVLQALVRASKPPP